MYKTDKSRIRVPLLDKVPIGSNETDRIALTYWTRSAAQDNVDALVKLGDYYFKGIGTSPPNSSSGLDSSQEEDQEGEYNGADSPRSRELGGQPQFEKAATFYQSAATSRLSAMAMWNLGWMHETGQGVPQVKNPSSFFSFFGLSTCRKLIVLPLLYQDFHLAKRYLDSALETSPSAYFPSTLSLISLYTRALYHVLFSPSSSSQELNALSLFGKDPASSSDDDDGNNMNKEKRGFVPQGGWGFGRAWRDIQRSWGIDPGPEPEVVPLGGTSSTTGGNNVNPEAQNHAGVVRADGGREPWETAQQEAILNSHNNKRPPRRVGEEEEEDEFYIGGDEDDGDLGGTVAIIALCMLLA